ATFSGTSVAQVQIGEAVDRITLHALDLEITEAWVEQGGERSSARVELDADAEWAVLSLDRSLAAGPATVHTAFTGVLNDKLVGFYRSTFTDHEGQTRTIACTQFESTHARRAFPCWDEPAFKATYAITLTVVDDLLAVSNAQEVARTALD